MLYQLIIRHPRPPTLHPLCYAPFTCVPNEQHEQLIQKFINWSCDIKILCNSPNFIFSTLSPILSPFWSVPGIINSNLAKKKNIKKNWQKQLKAAHYGSKAFPFNLSCKSLQMQWWCIIMDYGRSVWAQGRHVHISQQDLRWSQNR